MIGGLRPSTAAGRFLKPIFYLLLSVVLWLHHVADCRSGEGLRRQPEPERSRDARAERRLLELLDLLCDDLDQLLNLLQLRRDDLQQLLQMHELLLLKELQLLELLRQDLQELQKLWRGLSRADSISANRLTRERLKIRL